MAVCLAHAAVMLALLRQIDMQQTAILAASAVAHVRIVPRYHPLLMRSPLPMLHSSCCTLLARGSL
jgi:hypothetical protein